jgi:hypothetical protein
MLLPCARPCLAAEARPLLSISVRGYFGLKGAIISLDAAVGIVTTMGMHVSGFAAAPKRRQQLVPAHMDAPNYEATCSRNPASMPRV